METDDYRLGEQMEKKGEEKEKQRDLFSLELLLDKLMSKM
jgi:hypothetical protein